MGPNLNVTALSSLSFETDSFEDEIILWVRISYIVVKKIVMSIKMYHEICSVLT